jgi:hypothetical protein
MKHQVAAVMARTIYSSCAQREPAIQMPTKGKVIFYVGLRTKCTDRRESVHENE